MMRTKGGARPTVRASCMLVALVCGAGGTHGLSAQIGVPAVSESKAPRSAFVLRPGQYRHYFEVFRKQEKEATGQDAPDPWMWMQANIPWFESSDSNFQEIYYFRWYSFQKHIVSTPRGDVLSEFLPKMKWAGYGNTVAVAAPHQLREARWLRDSSLAKSDARFWFSADAPHQRDFSVAMADAVDAVTLATGDEKLSENLLPAMVDNYQAWEATHQDSNGLFWSIDTRDGMEVSISGDGYRPTLNSYMYADARAIERVAALKGEAGISVRFEQKADAIRDRINEMLWNPKDQFYEVLSPAADSGIRKQVKFKDPHTALQLSGVRELIGYVPWYFNVPPQSRDVAWKQVKDPQGFAASFGPTTAERRSPRFRFANDDQCQWNGPMWGFATTQTLIAMANVLHGPSQNVINDADYLRLFSEYVASHHLRLANGEVIPWLDEALDADTGAWITRRLLLERHSPLAGRGAYYDHSGFADPLITGLVGLEVRADNHVIVRPLLPTKSWAYFALDGLPYHGHLLTILYDKSGSRYGRGKGMKLLVDGKLVGSRRDLGPLEAFL